MKLIDLKQYTVEAQLTGMVKKCFIQGKEISYIIQFINVNNFDGKF